MKILSSLLLAVIPLLSCQKTGPKDIVVGKDQCDHCKMVITDVKYAAELVTEKGRVYKFDDISCANSYKASNTDQAKNGKTYVVDFPTGKFIEEKKAVFVQGGSIKSPMGGNTQAFSDVAQARKAAANLGAKLLK